MATDNNTAFIFPGQGSQRVGMLAAAAATSPIIEQTLAEASAVLGYDMWQLMQTGPQQQLNLTETTQPVLLACSVALWRSWCASGAPRPALLAGHSLGEFSALVCADALNFADAVQLVRQRGAFMQSAQPLGEGGMAAIIGLDEAAVNAACAEAARASAGVVAAANFNAPGQVVIAGQSAALTAAIAACKRAGAKRALPLPVSAAFHTALMKPAGAQLRAALADVALRPPAIPVVHNVHAQTETDPGRIRALLVRQLYRPVQWRGCVAALLEAGAQRLVECGPGKVLSGLNRRIDSKLDSYSLEQPEDFQLARAALE